MDFEEIYQRYAPAVHRFAFLLSGDRALADDITSETFVRAWTATSAIRQATLQNYLFTIAKNIFRDMRRKSRRNVQIDESIPDDSVTVEDQARLSSEVRQLMSVLAQLPEQDREVLLLRAQQGLDYDQIGDALGITPAAARVRVHRARAKLLSLMPESSFDSRKEVRDEHSARSNS